MKINDLIKKSDKLNLRTTDFDNYGHRLCHFSKENENIQILHCNVDMEEIITKSIDFNEIICGFYENNEFDTCILFYKLLELCEKGRIIYIIIDIENYYIIPEKNPVKKSYHKVINTPQTHSVSIIFNPKNNLVYDIFYINSHGHSVQKENIFEKMISKTRIKEYKFNNHINFIFMDMFIKELKVYFDKHFVNSELKSTIRLKYNKTERHNYYGCNLQNGDYYGICFIFPLIIYHYFDKYYNKARQFGPRNTIIIPSVAEMLNKNKLDLFVKSCFLDFCSEFKKVLLFRNNTYIDNFIEKKRTVLVKKILDKFLYLISQKHI